jgi:hypothetical protein
MFGKKKKQQELNKYEQQFKADLTKELEQDPFTKQRIEEGVWTGLDKKKLTKRTMEDFQLNDAEY